MTSKHPDGEQNDHNDTNDNHVNDVNAAVWKARKLKLEVGYRG